MYNCQSIANMIVTLRDSDLLDRLANRCHTPISTRVVLRLDFDNPHDVIAYEHAKSRCAKQFAEAFVWRADVAQGTATFGFTHFIDALLFGLGMPNAKFERVDGSRTASRGKCYPS